MTPAARAQMAIDILEGLEKTTQPADRFLKAWFKTRRFAGSGDRRAIGERMFAVQRARARLAHRMGSDAPRALVIASLLAEGADVDALFTGGYAPAPLTDPERAAIAAPPRAEPRWVEGEYPQWLDAELRRAFGEMLLDEMRALQGRAPVDIRVNTLKTSREALLLALRAEGFDAAAAPFAPLGIRMTGDAAKLTATPLFKSGAFEMQDEAAQIAAVLCDAQPGMRVCDLAAGAGGKSLALAATMRNQGEIVACDIRGDALVELEKRGLRAGATIIHPLLLPHAQPDGGFDRVFVDAPCSGTGTWRRQPELRWRLTPKRLAELTAIQDGLLDQAAGLTAPGGHLIYATCSILPTENQDRVVAFQARHPQFQPLDLSAGWSGTPIPGLPQDFRAGPAMTGTDGFYAAGFRKG